MECLVWRQWPGAAEDEGKRQRLPVSRESPDPICLSEVLQSHCHGLGWMVWVPCPPQPRLDLSGLLLEEGDSLALHISSQSMAVCQHQGGPRGGRCLAVVLRRVLPSQDGARGGEREKEWKSPDLA